MSDACELEALRALVLAQQRELEEQHAQLAQERYTYFCELYHCSGGDKFFLMLWLRTLHHKYRLYGMKGLGLDRLVLTKEVDDRWTIREPSVTQPLVVIGKGLHSRFPFYIRQSERQGYSVLYHPSARALQLILEKLFAPEVIREQGLDFLYDSLIST